ncbi:hypothetical protein STEG23_031825 [Scotinomys teguina]
MLSALFRGCKEKVQGTEFKSPTRFECLVTRLHIGEIQETTCIAFPQDNLPNELVGSNQKKAYCGGPVVAITTIPKRY